MNPYITTTLVTTIVFAIIAIIVTPKTIEGANAQRIAKGHATKSRDEMRREVRIIRLSISAVILVCLIALVVKVVQ